MERGCVFQEKHGWERPGWFSDSLNPVQPYDWYGVYGNKLNEDQRYPKSLQRDYTFDFPKHHNKVINLLIKVHSSVY